MGNDQSVDSKGTELEQIQEEQAVQDDIFSETFDTAEKLGDDQGDPKVDDLEKEAKSDAAQSGQPDQQKADDDSGKQADKQADASARKQSADASAAKDNEETYEQRWKSLQGILKSKDEKYESEKAQLLTELENLKKTVASLSDEKKDKKKGTDKSDSMFDDLSKEDQEALAEYEKDFDSVSKMEGLKRERALKKLEDRILEKIEARAAEIQDKIISRVQPIEESYKKSDEAAHFSTIRGSHPDFETHRDSGAILKWIEAKPRYLRESMKATYEQGTAEDVVDLISDFKTENNLLESNQNNQSRSDNLIDMDKKKAEKKQNLTAVITKRGSVDAGQGRADDFDSAYNEALKK